MPWMPSPVLLDALDALEAEASWLKQKRRSSSADFTRASARRGACRRMSSSSGSTDTGMARVAGAGAGAAGAAGFSKASCVPRTSPPSLVLFLVVVYALWNLSSGSGVAGHLHLHMRHVPKPWPHRGWSPEPESGVTKTCGSTQRAQRSTEATGHFLPPHLLGLTLFIPLHHGRGWLPRHTMGKKQAQNGPSFEDVTP